MRDKAGSTMPAHSGRSGTIGFFSYKGISIYPKSSTSISDQAT